ncbi:MAG: Rrf2 family transcriptional regulator [Candidatus Omnitrophica bacterium]|nr:Rrf2 family transcriptional regulator [Candidatus Omnitrophota bacterium]
MKITAQEEYGLRCLLQLAQAEPKEGLTVGEIARREGLSQAYVEKLLRLLSRAGIIHSVRGIRGGYLLNHGPGEISLGTVVRALGKVPTTQEICDRFTGNRASCIHIDDCCIRSAWSTLTQKIQSFLDGIALSDLAGAEAKATHLFAQRMLVETKFPLEKSK